jgi:secreted PhoX family phosphatase
MSLPRRGFVGASTAALGFPGLARAWAAAAGTHHNEIEGCGPLKVDASSMFDTPEGRVHTISRNMFGENAALAGVSFSPCGSTLFVNIYRPGISLAATAPQASLRA